MAIYTLKILNIARFLKHVWPFYNMHERVKNNLDKFIGCSCSVKISGLGKQAFNDILTLYRQMVPSYRNQFCGENHLTGFYLMVTLVLERVIVFFQKVIDVTTLQKRCIKI